MVALHSVNSTDPFGRPRTSHPLCDSSRSPDDHHRVMSMRWSQSTEEESRGRCSVIRRCRINRGGDFLSSGGGLVGGWVGGQLFGWDGLWDGLGLGVGPLGWSGLTGVAELGG